MKTISIDLQDNQYSTIGSVALMNQTTPELYVSKMITGFADSKEKELFQVRFSKLNLTKMKKAIKAGESI